jgi:hypothetical protein
MNRKSPLDSRYDAQTCSFAVFDPEQGQWPCAPAPAAQAGALKRALKYTV